MKRIFIRLLWLICALLIAGGIFYGSGYLWSLRTKPDGILLPEQAELSCAGSLPLGAETSVALHLTLPLWCRVSSAELTAPDGTVATGPLRRELRRHWSKRTWEFKGVLRGFRAGEAKNGSIALRLDDRGKEFKSASIPVPAFYVGEETAKQIPLQEFRYAGEVTTTPTHSRRFLLYTVGAGIILIVLAFLALWYFRRRRAAGTAERPYWERTLDAIGVLRGDLNSRRESGEAGFVRLTDIVRGYLEKRFCQPLTTLTTPEFLEDVDRKLAAELPEERPFLREFMNAADFVKFARVPADPALLKQAVDRAEDLVQRTIPRPEPEGENRVSSGKGGSSC